MHKLLFAILFVCISLAAIAQKRDSLFVVEKKDKWFVMHKVKKGDDAFTLAKKYHVPPAALAEVNHINYQTRLKENAKLYIPLGSYNQVNSKPANYQGRALFYKVNGDDNLFSIAKNAGVQQQTIQEWNKLTNSELPVGKILFIGWMLYDDPGYVSQVNATQNPSQKGTQQPVDTLTEEEKQYFFQTNNEQNVVDERGSAVFFGSGGRVKGTEMYFALHGTAPKGTIIKVYNPGTDKQVFVKVIGTLPGTKQYYNSIIGIAGGAKDVLGVTDEKAWCELKYAPN